MQPCDFFRETVNSPVPPLHVINFFLMRQSWMGINSPPHVCSHAAHSNKKSKNEKKNSRDGRKKREDEQKIRRHHLQRNLQFFHEPPQWRRRARKDGKHHQVQGSHGGKGVQRQKTRSAQTPYQRQLRKHLRFLHSFNSDYDNNVTTARSSGVGQVRKLFQKT